MPATSSPSIFPRGQVKKLIRKPILTLADA